jgi:peroxiredoxin
MSLSVNKWMSMFAVALALVAFRADSGLPSVGEPSPDFALASNTGVNLRLSEYRGEIVLLNFWALSVNVDDNRAKVEQDLRALKLGFPVMFDTDQAASKLYDLPTLPVTLLIDRRGQLRFVHQGYKAGDEKVYKDELANLLAE